MKVHETHNLAYIYILKSYKKLPSTGKDMGQKWKDLYNEYILEFGINERYKDYLNKRREIAILKCDQVITDDKTIETFIEIKEIDLKEMLDSKEQARFIDVLTTIEKFIGFPVDSRCVSVLKYYSYLRNLERASKNG